MPSQMKSYATWLYSEQDTRQSTSCLSYCKYFYKASLQAWLFMHAIVNVVQITLIMHGEIKLFDVSSFAVETATWLANLQQQA